MREKQDTRISLRGNNKPRSIIKDVSVVYVSSDTMMIEALKKYHAGITVSALKEKPIE